jgi:site-specific DNA-methyltransferase (adenine-specific)
VGSLLPGGGLKLKDLIMVSEVYNEDCMIGMSRYPDKFFELAIVDPPYGVGMDGNNNWSGSKHDIKDWDEDAPDVRYFNELFRISQNQIIWGCNHFISKMPYDSSCWIIWDKKNDGFSFADAELAWTSFKTAVRFFRYHRGEQTDERIHPTQKPVKLYKWLLTNYAEPGDKILDTHLGSGSSRIAAYDMGFDFYGFELDKDYYQAQEKRFAQFKMQGKLFT